MIFFESKKETRLYDAMVHQAFIFKSKGNTDILQCILQIPFNKMDISKRSVLPMTKTVWNK